MVAIGRRLDRKVAAVISDMEAPLGACIGNALEVREAIEILRGEHEERRCGRSPCGFPGNSFPWPALPMGQRKAGQRRSGRFAMAPVSVMRAMIVAQGGDGMVVEDLSRLPRVREIVPVKAGRTGWLWGMDAERIGEAAMHLGAGRLRKKDPIDPAVGLVLRPSRATTCPPETCWRSFT